MGIQHSDYWISVSTVSNSLIVLREHGLTFAIRLMVGYLMAYFSFFPWIHRHCRVRERDPDALQPEARLYWLLYSEL